LIESTSSGILEEFIRGPSEALKEAIRTIHPSYASSSMLLDVRISTHSVIEDWVKIINPGHDRKLRIYEHEAFLCQRLVLRNSKPTLCDKR